MNRVRANSLYVYQPVGMDRWDSKIYGDTKPGDIVRVVNLPGCPPANTMGHCHIETLEGQFAGLVLTNSLQPRQKGQSK